jgi:hypothetical protein
VSVSYTDECPHATYTSVLTEAAYGTSRGPNSTLTVANDRLISRIEPCQLASLKLISYIRENGVGKTYSTHVVAKGLIKYLTRKTEGM